MHSNIFLVVHLIFFALLAVFIGVMVTRAKRAERAQERLIQTLDKGSGIWFRINVCRPPFFARLFKLLAFEARGVLVMAQDHIRILAELPSGEILDRCIGHDELCLRWLGSIGAASGNLHWFSVGSAEQRLMICADTGFNALQSRKATADICRLIAPETELPQSARTEFALEKHPATLTVVMVFFLLLAFAFVDGIILNENELISPSGFGEWGIPALLLAAFPVYWWMARQHVPWRESSTLAILLGIALALAYIPAVKRIDQLLSDEGQQAYEYRLGPQASLEPVVSGPPPIKYFHMKEYWAQFDEGSTHTFMLTHGPLGLWQLDHSDLDKAFRNFYQNRRERESAAR